MPTLSVPWIKIRNMADFADKNLTDEEDDTDLSKDQELVILKFNF